MEAEVSQGHSPLSQPGRSLRIGRAQQVERTPPAARNRRQIPQTPRPLLRSTYRCGAERGNRRASKDKLLRLLLRPGVLSVAQVIRDANATDVLDALLAVNACCLACYHCCCGCCSSCARLCTTPSMTRQRRKPSILCFVDECEAWQARHNSFWSKGFL